MLHTLCYVSNSTSKLNSAELKRLYVVTKQKNAASNISGILVYNNGNFLQIMEGSKDELFKLYEKISNDKRHHHLIELVNEPVSERLFEDYVTGFELIDSNKDIKQLEDYLAWLKEAEVGSINKVIGVVEKFIERRTSY